ncbi:DNA-directed RNA polymerase subunit delta [Salipaludibacillus sp. LMS25]|jgi:DNA-directed RNA polymerase subunit delta|uniref:DNA-directed RNA polymerase subunit delta n=1 Tax=Salipaludibacillus sp. LMS25 TaxID=2924031 RepID=UPI0020D0A270|nr:DNA-directed RNA polymerase subunit delta [Salipaludibacillus sp. LMS25]UTR16286.1 DNA-directed RNA polymerase subunit delta [Salipaludibacillus sp. LMS25]
MMSIKDYSNEQLHEISMLEIAYELLSEEKKPIDYHALLKQVGDVKDMTEEQLNKRISHLYTEMSIDGRFVNIGDSRWGLRSWYPFDQTEEELSQTATKERKRKAKEDEEDYLDDTEDFDHFEDLEDELDELANEEDTDFDDLDEEDKFDDNDLDEDNEGEDDVR